jgi:hypothetical protein
LREIARELESIGLTTFWADQSDEVLLGLGHVVKVVIPEMIPLSQMFGARWLGTSRLKVKARNVGVEQFNEYPHPFA